MYSKTIIFIATSYNRENTISDVVNDYFAIGRINWMTRIIKKRTDV